MGIWAVLFPACKSTNMCYAEGPMMQDVRPVDQFNKIVVEDGLKILFTIGNTNDVQIQAQANVLPYIETKIKDKTLCVRIKDHTNLIGNPDILISVTGSSIHAIEALGGSSIECANDIVASNLTVNSSGGSKVLLKGRVGSVKVYGSGGGTVSSFDFTCIDYLDIDLSGGSKAELTAQGVVNVTLSGGSIFIYRGMATVGSSNITGGSVLEKQ